MNKNNPSTRFPVSPSPKKFRNSQFARTVQSLSRLITLVFIAMLIWAIYQAVVKKSPLPAWTWPGMLALVAIAIGLGIMVLVHRGVSKITGVRVRSTVRFGSLKPQDLTRDGEFLPTTCLV